jgi:hypothetical protein
LLELTQIEASLEEAYMSITEDALEFSGSRPQPSRESNAAKDTHR